MRGSTALRVGDIVKTERARSLRRDTTGAEAKLWRKLRNRGLAGHKFVRQAPIGRYFVDFACREKCLVIEIDGATHSTESELIYDAQRTLALADAGFRVVRIFNADVYENMDGVLETIFAALTVPK